METEQALPAEYLKNEQREAKKKLREISEGFARLFEIRDTGVLSENLNQIVETWQSLATRDGLENLQRTMDWYEENNHRINLYQIAGLQSEGWKNETTAPEKNEHLLTLKRLDVCLKQFEKTTEPSLAAKRLGQIIQSEKIPEHSIQTAIDTLARLGEKGKQILDQIIGEENFPLRRRLRAALSLLRFGHSSSDEKIETLLLEASKNDELEILVEGIELSGLVGGEVGQNALRKIGEKVKTVPAEQKHWLERDLVSTKLSVDSKDVEYLKTTLGDSMWQDPKTNIIFGSLKPMADFEKFVADNREKLEKIAEALKRTNEAFGSEPILFIDIIPDNLGKVANEGWTQNSIYLSKSLIEHPRVSVKTTVQGAIHEACERWESKGFVDADMEEDYVKLLGEDYKSSPLDKFRLRHRYDISSSRAGHPWDGTREYMAEAGSILLAEPDCRKKLFEPNKDPVAWSALDRVRDLIQKHST